jgi:hypothetical protein
MADSKITALTSIGASTDPANDPLVLVDVSDTSMAASGTTKKVTLNQLLGASGTATLASATITGDLTVDTNVLKVNSSTNRVGVNTASPTTTLDAAGTITISGGTSNARRLQFDASGVYLNYIESDGTAGAGYMVFAPGNAECYRIATGGTSTWSVGGSEAMRLNSTGLGLGGSPSYKLDVSGDLAVNGNENYVYLFSNYSIGNNARVRFRAVGAGGGSGYGGDFRISTRAANNAWNTDVLTIDSSANCIWTDGAGGTRMTLNSTGLGVGVTPSAGKRLHIVDVDPTILLQGNQTSGGSRFNRLQFANQPGSVGQEIYGGYFGTGALYLADYSNNGILFGVSNTSGTFTERARIDASGNLLVGKTAVNDFSIGFQTTQAGSVVSTLAASTNGTGSTMSVYSTGASAYRFYVGMGGTVFATNTTISAISDARLKENVQDIDVGLGAILALKPRKFDWKDGKGKDIKGDRGFIAQEFEQVFPQLVDEWKDNTPEGEAPYKSVRQDLIPVLVKAIQELAAEVNALKNA